MRNINSTPISIALADDHPLMRTALATLIQNTEGYEVSCQAQNGRELLNQINTGKPPDIVLLDINMPVMDGYQTLSAIRKKCKKIKVVAISMYNDSHAIQRMVALGANGYLSKSAHPEEIISTIDHVHKHGQYYPDSVCSKLAEGSKKEIHNTIAALTNRELVFLKYACAGLFYKEIAEKMHVSKYTVEDYRNSLYRKLNVSGRAALMLLNMKYKIVEIEW